MCRPGDPRTVGSAPFEGFKERRCEAAGLQATLCGLGPPLLRQAPLQGAGSGSLALWSQPQDGQVVSSLPGSLTQGLRLA